MAYYKPRCICKLRVPVMGTVSERLGMSRTREVVEFTCPVVKARLTRNDFNSADEASVDVTYDQIGVDPRLLTNAIVYLYMGNAESAAEWQPQPTDLRFIGIVTTADRSLDAEARTISIKALDYTTLFLSMKPYPQASGAPAFSQTLREAWATICDNTGFYDFSAEDTKITSSVAELRENIRGIPDDSILDQPIGGAVLSRIAKFGLLQIPHEADAWAVWRACTDPLGLLTWIDLDTCVVATAPDYYSASTPAVFTYGVNIRTLSESRDVASLNSKGMHLTSFDVINGKTIESFWPERDDVRVVKKRLTASKKRGTPGLAPVTDYEHQIYPYPCTQDTLDEVTARVWEERSRQELEGKLSTSEMLIETTSALVQRPVLGLKHGDQIAVKLDSEALDEMRSLPTVFARSLYLLQRGFPTAMASLIARDQGYLESLLSTFVIKDVSIDYDAEALTFSAEIGYCSRINPSTGATDETEAGDPEL